MATVPLIAPLIMALLVFLLAMAVVGGASVLGAWKLITRKTEQALPSSSPRAGLEAAPSVEEVAADLQRYPERLEALQDSLEQSLRASESQAMHLTAKRNEIAAKPGREAIAQRYTTDLELLSVQSDATQRVLATVWKTRAILALRVHLASAARERPDLDHLPQPMDVAPGQLDEAARAYSNACRALRLFVRRLDVARDGIHGVIPSPSVHAEVLAEHRGEVELEAAGIERIVEDLRERMDALADTLDYLSDRFRTQKVVEGTTGVLDLGPEAGQLLQEVAVAIRALDDLSAVGEAGLADAAVDGLASEIANLEKVGLDVNLQADADREVERLLASFTRAGEVPTGG